MKTLFYVSRNSATSFMVCNQLAKNFEVHPFEDVNQCINAIRPLKQSRDEHPDVIILDYEDSDSLNLQELREIYQSAEDSNLLLMLPSSSQNLLFDVIQEGIVNYIVKKGDYAKQLTTHLLSDKIMAI